MAREDIVFGLRRGECFKGTKTERVSRVMEKCVLGNTFPFWLFNTLK